MKIGIIGDLHIAPIPEKRIDDYFETGKNKLEQIAQNCDAVIHLGDVFTHSKVEEKYVYDLITHLRYCSNKYGTHFYSIVGNHDVLSEDESNLHNSSLGLLSICGAITLILPNQPLVLDNYMFNTLPVNFEKAKKALSPAPQTGHHQVLLLHHLYETGTDCFTYEDLRTLGYNSVFLGHDHKPLEQGRIIYPEFTVYRSGSTMRNRAEDYNFTRCMYYYVLENNNVSCQVINCRPAQEVFKVEAITRQAYKKEQFIESLNNVIDKYKNNISKQQRFSLRTILQELMAPQRVIEGIRKKYENRQESFY